MIKARFTYINNRHSDLAISRNGKITLSYIDISKSCFNRNFFTSIIFLLMLFTKKKSRKFSNLQYYTRTCSKIITTDDFMVLFS